MLRVERDLKDQGQGHFSVQQVSQGVIQLALNTAVVVVV